MLLETIIPEKMKAWQLQGIGIENLKLAEVTLPPLNPSEILIRVKAVSLNYRDKLVVEGKLGEVKESLIPVADFAGEVIAIGSEVSGIIPGDRVMSHLWSRWLDGVVTSEDHKYVLGSALDGGLSEYCILEHRSIVKIPDFFTYEEAATFPTAGLTAWFALICYGKLQTGSTVLVQGSGGVSVFGAQIAKAFGAKVIVTTSSDEKAEKLRQIGVDEVINYQTTPDWVKETLVLTRGKGVDHLLEIVGGDGVNDSVQAVRYNGMISLIGFLSRRYADLDLIGVMSKQIQLQGVAVGHLKALQDMVDIFAVNQIKPVIEKVYEFEDALSAYEHLDKGSVGKIVIKVS